MHHKDNSSLLVFVPFPQFIMILKVPFIKGILRQLHPHTFPPDLGSPIKKTNIQISIQQRRHIYPIILDA
jgi:hypothetical protein